MNTIRQLRRATGLSQADFAASVGTSQPTIAAYESGSKSPTLRTVERMAAALDLDIETKVVPALTREDRRSLAMHREVARRLEEAPEIALVRARRNLEKWQRLDAGGDALRKRWALWIELPVTELVMLMLDPGPLAREMRQVSPFAGLLSAAERTAVLRAFQQVNPPAGAPAFRPGRGQSADRPRE
ncbi:MAG: hypothetical protein CSB44_04830 [Gammaproteobacteria bacterium]|nr:MAG: hypothetical protein CSB44_04830 [Gammaproteobacteria bacterium]PIE35454.1 MAG: hypothetical protein CSA54_05550 [Gammaproteobacteria bacterium]